MLIFKAYFKISELIQYYDVIKGLYKKKNNDNTQSKEKQIDNKKSDEIDLLKIMRESHHNNQFEYFEQPDKSSKAR
jgi:protein-tyrosine-phosphatase